MPATLARAADGGSALYAIQIWRDPLAYKYKNNGSIMDFPSLNNIKNDKNKNRLEGETMQWS